MNGQGGFLIPSSSHVSTSSRNGTDQSHHDEPTTARTVRALTQKQEVRLMNYLEEALQEISRGYAKRHQATAATSSVPTLPAFVDRMHAILAIIASIPIVGSSAQLLISYLLRYTNEMCDGIVGYEAGQSDENPVVTGLEAAVDALDLLDRVWAHVLRGKMVDLAAIRRNVRRQHEQPRADRLHSLSYHDPAQTPQRHYTTVDGRYPDAAPQSDMEVEAFAVMGSKGLATVGQTQRIRLRNVLTLARESLFAWMRIQLEAPLPPQVDQTQEEAERERRVLVGVEGDQDDAGRTDVMHDPEGMEAGIQEETEALDQQKDNDDDDEALELEEVNGVDQEESAITELGEASQGDQKHYDDLFARHIDPDADDEEDDGEADTMASHKGKRAHSEAEDAGDGESQTDKRRRRLSNGDDDTTLHEPTEAESVGTLMGTSTRNAATVMRWDVTFARLFRRTLRGLSEIQDRREQDRTKDTSKPSVIDD